MNNQSNVDTNAIDIVDGSPVVNNALVTVLKMVVSQEGWFLMLTFHCVLHRELLLNNNQLRVLPFELGKLFQLQTLGLKGEWLISVFCGHSSLEIPLFS